LLAITSKQVIITKAVAAIAIAIAADIVIKAVKDKGVASKAPLPS
jgi:hypothetical protein